MLEASRPQSGDRVLEIACGAGRVGFQAAQLVGPEGSVLCTDFAEDMVAAVRELVGEFGLENVEAEVVDAEQMSFDANHRFDVALCRMGFMLMNDPARALANTHAALRPEGRLAFAVWGTAEENPWLSLIFNSVMKDLNAPPPPPGTPGPFALGSPGRAEELTREAGFGDVRVERLEADRPYESAEAWWDEVISLGGPVEALLDAMEDERSAAVRAAAIDSAGEFAQADGSLRLPVVMLAAAAVA